MTPSPNYSMGRNVLMPPSCILHATTAHYWSCLSCWFFPMIPLYKLPYSIKIVTKIKILVAKFKLKYYFTNKYAYMLRPSKKPKKWLPRPFGQSLSSFLHKQSASLQKIYFFSARACFHDNKTADIWNFSANFFP